MSHTLLFGPLKSFLAANVLKKVSFTVLFLDWFRKVPCIPREETFSSCFASPAALEDVRLLPKISGAQVPAK